MYRVTETGASEARAKHANYTQHNQYGDSTGKLTVPVVSLLVYPSLFYKHNYIIRANS